MAKIVLADEDIEFFNGNRVKRNAVDEKIIPVIQELKLRPNKKIEEYLEIYCPRCGRKMFFIEKDGYILVYGCKSFGCYSKISISTFPIMI